MNSENKLDQLRWDIREGLESGDPKFWEDDFDYRRKIVLSGISHSQAH